MAPEAVESVLVELRDCGLLDDAAYARRFAEDRRVLSGWGAERIARDLEHRGVAQELVEAALGDRTAEEEAAAAHELLRSRYPTPPRDDRERDRAWRFLVRRGYAPELAYAAVREHERAA